MSGSFEKSVKGATKIKAAPPKSKYIEHILVATHSGEAGVAEVCRALQNRLRDSTWTVVFKGLITVHLMIREGSPDVTLQYLAKHPTVLAISTFTDMQTQGRNIRHYSNYLVERAKAFAKSKTDWVRDGEERIQRSTIEKGLLREVEIIQRQLHALIKCDILETEPDDEISITAFRLLVMDLLALFQTLNQGMINVLGHFFELSKPDAERAMDIYRTFIRQTDFVVAYLSVARKHEHHTRVEVPKLTHAPVNLGRQLEDYLTDPDFDTHRRQYLAEQAGKKKFNTSKNSEPKESLPKTTSANNPFPTPFDNLDSKPPAAKASEVAKPAAKGPEPDLIDFFESIEQNQTTVNPQPSNTFQPQSQGQAMPMGYQATGMQQQQPGMYPQQTGFQQPNGFQQPQQTGFVQQQQSQPQPMQPNFTGAGFGGFTPASPTGFQSNTLSPIPQDSMANFQNQNSQPQQQQPMFGGGLQPMATGQQTTNPFRQSMLLTQQTGMSAQSAPSSYTSPMSPTQTLQRQSTNPFARMSPVQQQAPAPLQPTPTGTNPFARTTQPVQDQQQQGQQQQQPSALAPQPTGSTNPFRQGDFVNHQTGMGWQHNQTPMGGGLDQMQTQPVFPRPQQNTAWSTWQS